MTNFFSTIKKPRPSEMPLEPNLDYDKVRPGFQWGAMSEELDWLPGGWLNAAHEAVDRQANGPLRDKVAIVWEGKYGETETYSFGEIRVLSNKFANVLKSLGVGRGDRVFILMDHIPEVYIAFFGILKVGAIAGHLSPFFGPDLLRDRLQDSDTKILVTQPDLRRRVTSILPELFELQHIIVVNKNHRDPESLDWSDLGYEEEMGKASANSDVVLTSQYDYSSMHYAYGTTGKLKGVVHRHQAVIQQYATGKWVLDFHENDIYWCMVDPGELAKASCGILASWTNGVTQLIYEGRFEADTWYRLIEKHKVTVLCTTPSTIHMLMRAGDDVIKRYNLSSLRHINSGGGPLSRKTVVWSNQALGTPVHDSWWQAETGTVIIANYPAMDIRPGSMGRPIPGVDVGILDDDYNLVSPGNSGNLAVRPEWPAMFHAYWNTPEMYNSRFRKGWYISGDRARVDEDGYIWFLGRVNDVISTQRCP